MAERFLATSLVGASDFWRLTGTVRPLHPETVERLFVLAGFDAVERVDLRPFPTREHLPELVLADLPPEQRELADGLNRLRDDLDALMFGAREFAVVGSRAG